MYIKNHGMGEAMNIKTCSLKEPQKRFSKYNLMGWGQYWSIFQAPLPLPLPRPHYALF